MHYVTDHSPSFVFACTPAGGALNAVVHLLLAACPPMKSGCHPALQSPSNLSFPVPLSKDCGIAKLCDLTPRCVNRCRGGEAVCAGLGDGQQRTFLHLSAGFLRLLEQLTVVQPVSDAAWSGGLYSPLSLISVHAARSAPAPPGVARKHDQLVRRFKIHLRRHDVARGLTRCAMSDEPWSALLQPSSDRDGRTLKCCCSAQMPSARSATAQTTTWW